MYKFGLIKENILNEKERYLVDTEGNSWESLYTAHPHPYYIATDINKRIVGMFDDPKEMTLGNLIVYGIDDNQGYTYHYNGTINNNKAWDEKTNSIVDYKVPYPDESRPDADTLGFMVQDMYDPNKKEVDAFSMGNMNETTNALILTPDERSKISNSVDNSIKITGSDGLTGGGNLTADRQISLSEETKNALDKANKAVQFTDLGELAKKDKIALTDIEEDVLVSTNITETDDKSFVTKSQKNSINTAVQPADLGTLAKKNNITTADISGYDSTQNNKILGMDGWTNIDTFFKDDLVNKLKGEKGDQGIQGLKGDKGDKGDKGEAGTPADITKFGTLTGNNIWQGENNFNKSIRTIGEFGNIYTSGGGSDISTRGVNSDIYTTGNHSDIYTRGTYSDIYTTGEDSDIYTMGAYSNIYTSGNGSHIYTGGNYSINTNSASILKTSHIIAGRVLDENGGMSSSTTNLKQYYTRKEAGRFIGDGAYLKNYDIGSLKAFLTNVVPENYVRPNGALLNRKDYPELWEFANKSGMIVSDTDWQDTTKQNWGKWSSGDGSTTFRVPMLDGEFIRVLDNRGNSTASTRSIKAAGGGDTGGPVNSGISAGGDININAGGNTNISGGKINKDSITNKAVDANRTPGSWQGDAIRNLTGKFGQLVWGATSLYESNCFNGVFSSNWFDSQYTNLNVEKVSPSDGPHSYPREFIIDASLQVPTANENRPRNIAYNWFIRAL